MATQTKRTTETATQTEDLPITTSKEMQTEAPKTFKAASQTEDIPEGQPLAAAATKTAWKPYYPVGSQTQTLFELIQEHFSKKYRTIDLNGLYEELHERVVAINTEPDDFSWLRFPDD